MAAPDQALRARIEDRLRTILSDVNPLTGEEDEDLGYDQLSQALRRLAGRLVHGIASEIEQARLEQFVAESDVLIRETLVDFAVDIEGLRRS
jgi:CHASE1-domain containing sensor protein